MLGEVPEAPLSGAEALEIADRLGNAKLRLRTVANLLQARYDRGDHGEGVNWLSTRGGA